MDIHGFSKVESGCDAGGLELLDSPEPENILVGPRVSIQQAQPEHVNALWRFAIAGTPWISAPKNTLRPAQQCTCRKLKGEKWFGDD